MVYKDYSVYSFPNLEMNDVYRGNSINHIDIITGPNGLKL